MEHNSKKINQNIKKNTEKVALSATGQKTEVFM